jgi:hypothetical protein
MRRLRTGRLVVASVAGLLLALVTTSPALAQPANDDFDTATVVTELPFIDTMSTVDATTAGDDPFCDGFEHTVWYSFTPAQDVTIRADTSGSDYATSLSVYTGSRGALSQVACASAPAQVSFNASASTTYFFMVASVCCGNPGGNLVFNVTSEAPPANDEIGGAIPLTLNTTVTEDTTLATTAPTDPTQCGFQQGNTVWFSFTATQSQPINVDRTGSSYSGPSYVLTDLGSGPVVIGCSQSGNGVRFDASAGTTYYFMIASSFGEGGQLQLTLRPGIVMTVVINPNSTLW